MAVETAPVPDQPVAGLGVDVLAEAGVHRLVDEALAVASSGIRLQISHLKISRAGIPPYSPSFVLMVLLDRLDLLLQAIVAAGWFDDTKQSMLQLQLGCIRVGQGSHLVPRRGRGSSCSRRERGVTLVSVPPRADPGRMAAGGGPLRIHPRPARDRLRPAADRDPASLRPRRQRHLRFRARDHRLHARPAARIRRRPHRCDRQHDPQADDRRAAAARGRLLLLARPLDDRLPARAGIHARDPRPQRSGLQRRLLAAFGDRADRPDRLRHLPVHPRDAQPAGPDQHREDLPQDAPGPLQRGRARGAARTTAAS